MRRSFILSTMALLLAVSQSIFAQEKISLNGKWNLEFWPQEDVAVTDPTEVAALKTTKLTATVPGNVELDLLAAGMIKDPEIGNNIYDLRPYEFCQWMYSKSFNAPEISKGQKVIMDFEGIDCLADIWLNGQKVGSAEDAMIAHKYDITDIIKPGENSLQVIIRSAVLEAQNFLVGTYSFRHYTESVWIRKPRHCYGWDIMPRLVSAGLWRDVSLIVQNPVTINNVHWVTVDTNPATGEVSAFVDIQIKYPASKIDKVRLNVKLERNGKVAYEDERLLPTYAWRTEFKLDKADLWWPKGYGEPALYDGTLTLIDEDGTVLASDTRKVGFRTVRLDRSEMIDENGKGEFCFYVNGERIYVRGTNWVPLDGFHSRDAKWVDSTLDMVVDLNCNMIRCWGGNVYEDTPFYDRCDREGIMVWQDFSMAGIIYPQDQAFVSKLREEIKQVVLKFRSHPSLALWSGNNENDNSLLWTLPTFH
ncbi:MAG: glycoside hydrolase family 2, partial [Bacteroidales bacterium]|nr:glycoside hydrolase family 2 [Bacteroidales bacterium]